MMGDGLGLRLGEEVGTLGTPTVAGAYILLKGQIVLPAPVPYGRAQKKCLFFKLASAAAAAVRGNVSSKEILNGTERKTHIFRLLPPPSLERQEQLLSSPSSN